MLNFNMLQKAALKHEYAQIQISEYLSSDHTLSSINSLI